MGSVTAHRVARLVTGSVAAHRVAKLVMGSVAAHRVAKSQATSATDGATKELFTHVCPSHDDTRVHIPACFWDTRLLSPPIIIQGLLCVSVRERWHL
jgi:hypothetical protein